MRIALLSLTAVFYLLCTGCANFQKMPLTSGVASDITRGQSVQFGRIVVVNKNKPEHQPELQEIIVRTKDGRRSFIKPLLVEEDGLLGRQYIFSLAFPPGEATLELIRFTRRSYLLHGTLDLPIHQKLSYTPRQLVYVGNILVTVLPRQKGDPRAGRMDPLFDHSIMGFSNGVFAVDIRDFLIADTELLHKQLPVLANTKVRKKILKPWSPELLPGAR